MSKTVSYVNIHVVSKRKYCFSKCILSFSHTALACNNNKLPGWGGLLLTITNPGCWARLPIPGPTTLPTHILFTPPDCLRIWQPGRPSSCAASQPAIAQLHPALETRQMTAGENRREDNVCVCVCVWGRQNQVEWEKKRGVCDHMPMIPSSMTSKPELNEWCHIFTETKLASIAANDFIYTHLVLYCYFPLRLYVRVSVSVWVSRHIPRPLCSECGADRGSALTWMDGWLDPSNWWILGACKRTLDYFRLWCVAAQTFK